MNLARSRHGTRLAGFALTIASLSTAKFATSDDTPDRAPAAPALSPKQLHALRRAHDDARSGWYLDVESRAHALRPGEFPPIAAAAEAALAKFPDEREVEFLELLTRLNGNDPMREYVADRRVAGWVQDLALRALDRLPAETSLRVHHGFVLRLGSDRDAEGKRATGEALAGIRRRAATAIIAWAKRLLDALDPRWDPTTSLRHYAPVHRAGNHDPGFGGQEVIGGTEEDFRKAEDAYFTAVMKREDRWQADDLRDHYLYAAVMTLANMYGWSPADDDEILRLAAPLADFGLGDLVLTERDSRTRAANSPTVQGVRFNLRGAGGWARIDRPPEIVLRATNETTSPITVPLRMARAAFVHGGAEARVGALPPKRSVRSDDLVVIAPGASADWKLDIPTPVPGFARVLVALQNDATHVGNVASVADVWTGSVSFESLLDIRGLGSSRGRVSTATEPGTRSDASPERQADDALDPVSRVPIVCRDALAVRRLRLFAFESNDPLQVAAALHTLRLALEFGHGLDAHFALAPIASDPTWADIVRVSAIDGLGVLAKGRLVHRYLTSESVSVSIDVTVPSSIVEDAKACLARLVSDKNVSVASRAIEARGN